MKTAAPVLRSYLRFVAHSRPFRRSQHINMMMKNMEKICSLEIYADEEDEELSLTKELKKVLVEKICHESSDADLSRYDAQKILPKIEKGTATLYINGEPVELSKCEIVWNNAPTVSYYKLVMELVNAYNLEFFQNPGGGEFVGDALVNGRCQVPLMDTKEDYEILIANIKSNLKE